MLATNTTGPYSVFTCMVTRIPHERRRGLESRFGAVLEPSAVCNLGRSQLLAQVSSSTLRHPSLNGLSFLA